MLLDAECSCGAELHIDTSGVGNSGAEYDMKAMFREWQALHASCLKPAPQVVTGTTLTADDIYAMSQRR